MPENIFGVPESRVPYRYIHQLSRAQRGKEIFQGGSGSGARGGLFETRRGYSKERFLHCRFLDGQYAERGSSSGGEKRRMQRKMERYDPRLSCVRI